MYAWVRRALCAAGLAGGVVLLGIGLAEAASADDGPTTTGESGILSGNQAGVDADAPINLSGNQVTVIGQDNDTTSTGSASTGADSGGSPTTSGQDGIGSGNQVDADADAPVNISGNQVTVIGQDNDTTSTGSASTGAESSGSPTTSGQSGIGSGNQVAVDGDVPVNISGNQVTVIGQDNTVGSSGGSTTASEGSGGPGTMTTSGEDSLLGGNQLPISLLVPVSATGNQATVIGQDNELSSTGGSSTGSTGGGEQSTTGEGGAGSGNQVPVDAQVPVDISGNQVTVVGQDNTVTSSGGTSTGGENPSGTSPPGGGVVSPPATGGEGAAAGPQGSGHPGTTVLPSTGADADLLALAVLGLMLLSAGLVLGRPRRLTVR